MIDWKKCPDAVQVTVNYLDANGDTIKFDVFAPPTQTKTVADAVEQEGEKWTHEYDNSNPRRLKIICDKPDVNGEIAVIVNGPKGAFYTKTLPSKIRLIKPTISKAEAWDKIYDSIHDCGDAEFAFNSIAEQYDII